MFKVIGVFAGATVIAVGLSKGLLTANAQRPVVASQPKQVAAAVTNTPQAVSLAADGAGHFVADVKLNGIFVKGLIDTGATSVAIPLHVAKTLGIQLKPSDYNTQVMTANGKAMAARVRLSEVRVSTIVVRDVEAIVVPQGLSTVLVGMSFIRHLKTEMSDGRLVLRQ